jgi:uncharacterized protein YejL (UPF0352 family)
MTTLRHRKYSEAQVESIISAFSKAKYEQYNHSYGYNAGYFQSMVEYLINAYLTEDQRNKMMESYFQSVIKA